MMGIYVIVTKWHIHVWWVFAICNVSWWRHQIKWKYFPCYWPFVWGIHRSTVNSPHKGQWRGALMFSLICALNKWLSKQSWGWWFETSSCSLRRHYTPHTTKLLGGILVSLRPSVCPSIRPSVLRPSRIPCLLCSAYSSGWIHFIFVHLIKQLQKVCCI